MFIFITHPPMRAGNNAEKASRCPDRGTLRICSISGFTPKAADQASLFDHLVGAGEQGRRHVDAEHPGSLCVDDELD